MAVLIPYVKQSWTDGSGGGTPVSAARLGVVEEGVFDAHYMPTVRVTHNAAQAVLNNTETTLAFNTERFDQVGNAASTMHDTVTNNSRLTCRYAGVYLIIANIEWSAAPVGVALRLRLNGTTYIAHAGAGAGDIRTPVVSTLWSMAVNDYVEVRVTQTSGGSINVNSTASYSPEFMMCRVG